MYKRRTKGTARYRVVIRMHCLAEAIIAGNVLFSLLVLLIVLSGTIGAVMREYGPDIFVAIFSLALFAGWTYGLVWSGGAL